MKSLILFLFLFSGLVGCALLGSKTKSKKELKSKTERTPSSEKDWPFSKQTKCVPFSCKVNIPHSGHSCIRYNAVKNDLMAAYSVLEKAARVLKNAKTDLEQAKANSNDIETYSLASIVGISGKIGNSEQKAMIAYNEAKEAFDRVLADYDAVTDTVREAEDNMTNEDWPCETNDEGCHVNRYGDYHCHSEEDIERQ